jgi:hypothetical protein
MYEVVCAARKLQALYYILSTDGSVARTVGWSEERRSQWRGMDRLTLRSGGLSLLVLFKFSGWGSQKKQQNSTVNRNETFAAVKPWGPTALPANSREGQTYGLFSG